jgi:outer membrane protein assembly factor BamB
MRLGCLFALLIATNVVAFEPDAPGNWLGFRGPDAAGISKAKASLPQELSAPGVLKWKVQAPAGHSSPIIVDDSVIITGFEPKKLSTFCFELASGKLRWRRDVDSPEFEKVYQHGPATPTPVSDGKQVISVFGSFGVIAYDMQGTELWRQTRPIKKNMFGSASSPTIIEDRLIVFAGTEEESLLQALEPGTGKVLWERKRPGPASSWATPVLWRSPEQRAAILIYEPFHLRAIALEDGAELWSVPNLADEPVTTPQQFGDFIFTTSYNLRTNLEAIGLPTFEVLLKECDVNGDGEIDAVEVKTNKSILSRPDADGQGDHPLKMFFRMLDADKSGKISAAEWPKIKSWMESWNHANGLLALKPGAEGSPPTLAWEHASGVPECPSPIVVDGRIYMVRNGGVVTCVDANAGKEVYKQRLGGGGPYYASPVAASGRIILVSERGQVTQIESTSEPKVISRFEVGEPVWATPALGSGQIVLRSEKHLWLFASP